MPFIGNQPALSYTSFAKQDFTTSATTSYTLDQPVANANELALFINFVRQEPTTAYTASGTSLTLTSATSASDDMYCVFLGKAIQTVNPPSGSVGTSQLADSAVTSAKLASGVLPTNEHKFSAYLSSNQTGLTSGSWNKVNINAEKWDTSNYFDTSNYRFLPTDGVSGYYHFNAEIDLGGTPTYGIIGLYKNGSLYQRGSGEYATSSELYMSLSTTILLNGSTDYVELYCYTTFSGGGTFFGGANGDVCYLNGYKLIG